jgi:hypothetical protein
MITQSGNFNVKNVRTSSQLHVRHCTHVQQTSEQRKGECNILHAEKHRAEAGLPGECQYASQDDFMRPVSSLTTLAQ